MKVTILNGNQTSESFDKYLAELERVLEKADFQVNLLDLRNLSLKYCTGCFECWTRTPGLCDRDLASQEMDRSIINSDFALWAAPLKMGFPSALLKTALDKHLPLIHPYLEVDQGEAHHLKRYSQYPRVGLLIEKENDTDQEDIKIVGEIFSRIGLNMKSKLDFMETTDLPAEALAQKIINPRKGGHLYQKKLGPIPGSQIVPPIQITAFNGSPRGKNGNTPILMKEFLEGFGGEYELYHIIQVKDLAEQVRAFQNAECVWLGFPLYTDAMPGVVKNFFEALEHLRGIKDNPPIGFLVQSGFPEGLHSRYIERYLEKFAKRLGSPYLGTIVKGGGEGVRGRPPESTRALFEKLNRLGTGFRESGRLDPKILEQISKPERYHWILGPVFKVFLKTDLAHSYFDNMLHENSAFESRNDQPFWEGT